MKTCPVCALDLEDTYLFCPDDGSSLSTPAIGSSEIESPSASERVDKAAGAVVLYCPACAAEYPLTFSVCPVHGLQLTKHSIPRLPKSRSPLHEQNGSNDAKHTVSGPHFQRNQSSPTKRLTTLDLKRPLIEIPQSASTTVTLDDDNDLAHSEVVTALDAPSALPAFDSSRTAFDNHAPLADANERGFERPGFRIAAIATGIGLAVFGILAIYAFISNLTRRPTSAAVQIASETQTTPLPFVATPQAAQDYKDEAHPPTASTAQAPETERHAERARNESSPSSSPEIGVRKATVAEPLLKPRATAAPPAPVAPTKVSKPPMPPLPRGNSGGFDARLIRVRSRKTPAGFRYDLTFNMLEQAGRSTQWQRVLINTRSASGMSHSEAIPFSHRLGATGALTFTISVELTGRSEADWQGRIVCTTLGWDNKGAPLQASFGANVTP